MSSVYDTPVLAGEPVWRLGDGVHAGDHRPREACEVLPEHERETDYGESRGKFEEMREVPLREWTFD